MYHRESNGYDNAGEGRSIVSKWHSGKRKAASIIV
jgi:hypothetical protein